jgi:uncharacterized membrane protein YdjX (TVP38/TMEM64 family)
MLSKTNKFKKALLFSWLCLIIACLFYYFTHTNQFSAANIASYLRKFNSFMVGAYLIISILRGFTLIPSTPFVIAGGIIFPGQEWLILVISLLGIIGSATLIYYFSDLLKLSNTIEKIYPQHKLKQKMESKYGLLFVFFWSFFPVVPTDAVCYAAGASKMNFLRFILAVFLGELIICSFYVFTGSSIINLFI